MHSTVPLPLLGLLGFALLILFVLLEVGVIEAAYQKLGMSHRAVSGLLMLSIFGSYINIPVGSIAAKELLHDRVVIVDGMEYVVPRVQAVGHTIIAVNLGGAVIPILLSVYLLWRVGGFLPTLVATAAVSVVVHRFSRVVPGVGIAVPTFIPGVVAAILAAILDRRRSASVAYVAGTIGCLVGADLMNLGALSRLQAPIASIGGAGTFDGVFVSGIIAVLLA
jgi:uncharacterized membrane protein